MTFIDGSKGIGQQFNDLLEVARNYPGNRGNASAFEELLQGEGVTLKFGEKEYTIKAQDQNDDGVQDFSGFPTLEELQEQWFNDNFAQAYANVDGQSTFRFPVSCIKFDKDGSLLELNNFDLLNLTQNYSSLNSNLNGKVDVDVQSLQDLIKYYSENSDGQHTGKIIEVQNGVTSYKDNTDVLAKKSYLEEEIQRYKCEIERRKDVTEEHRPDKQDRVPKFYGEIPEYEDNITQIKDEIYNLGIDDMTPKHFD